MKIRGIGNVLWDIDHHRARPTRTGQIEGFFDGRWNIRRVFYQKTVLNNWAGDSHHVCFLKGVCADQMGLDLP